MIGRAEALTLLERELHDPKRMAHSVAVAETMESLARQYGRDAEKWYLTGLLHDIDLPETIDDLRMHGIVAKDKLQGLLPPRSIDAIMSHDYRTGIPAKTKIAKALVFADLLDNLRSNVGMPAIEECRSSKDWQGLKERYPNKEYHIEVVKEYLNERPGLKIDVI